jgi:hypothetical protein
MRNVKRMAAATNRLRSEGTDHLLAAGRCGDPADAPGAKADVAQSLEGGLEESRRRPGQLFGSADRRQMAQADEDQHCGTREQHRADDAHRVEPADE